MPNEISEQAVPGSVVPSGALVTPGGPQGTSGAPGAAGPTAVSTDVGNIALLGTDSKVLVPSSALWDMRLRSFNAVGNPNFEVDQRNIYALTPVVANAVMIDRWALNKIGTMAISTGSQPNNLVSIPGASPAAIISRSILRTTLTTAQASLGAGDYLQITQLLEGPQIRELAYSVTSLTLIVRCNISGNPGLKFGVTIADSPATKCLSKLCTIPAGSTAWQLIQLPNLPSIPLANFSTSPGVLGAQIRIGLGAGTTYMSPANDTWQTGNYIGAVGQDNFASKATSSTFDVGFVQWEPGAVCTTPMDKSFDQNYEECLRYFQKSQLYGNAPNASNNVGALAIWSVASTAQLFGFCSFRKPMAKTPTLTLYSPFTGAANTVRNYTASTELAVASVVGGDSGFNGCNLSAAPAVSQNLQANWVADTGW